MSQLQLIQRYMSLPMALVRLKGKGYVRHTSEGTRRLMTCALTEQACLLT
jgi:hypothetical protein